jgi:hypothetical protein
MNQKQKDYARERINSLYNKKSKEITKQNTTPARHLRKSEKLDLIYSGKVTLVNRNKLDNPYSFSVLYDFSNYENDIIVNEEKIRGLLDPIKKLRTTAIDTIMLGDAEEALKIIREFEQKMEGGKK